jgi:hypothetical protein
MKVMCPLDYPGSYAIGFLITFLAGLTVRRIKTRYIEEAPPGVPYETRELKGGCFLGFLERTVYFLAMMVGVSQFIGAWLAFKVASKWQVWTTITKVDPVLDELNLGTRRRWQSHVLQSFLIGSLLNILYAGLGILIAEVIAYKWNL